MGENVTQDNHQCLSIMLLVNMLIADSDTQGEIEYLHMPWIGR